MTEQQIQDITQPQQANKTETAQKNMQTWLEEEEKNIKAPQQFEQREALRLEENKIMAVEVDFSVPFQKWNTTGSKGQPLTKAIIPVIHEGIKKNWWLNCANPIYRDVIKQGKTEKTLFKVLRTGSLANTKYVLVE